MSQTEETVAEAYLALLASRGIDYIFGNAGTDFPPIIEAYSKAKTGNARFPTPVLAPHENVAIAMAHGYYMATGRMQAVMVHVGLGTANAMNGIINAARQNVPVLFTAGRTPIVEWGLPGGRNNYINWAQEMFDQGAMVREFVKWDYELRQPVQLETVVDRAIALAQSDPKGPVYLTLPREVLASGMNGYKVENGASIVPAATPHGDPAVLKQAVQWLAQAKRPVLITSNAGREAASFAALSSFAAAQKVPVVQYRPRYLCLADDHAMHCGYDPNPFLKDADLVIVADSDVPWMPEQVDLPAGCKVVHLGLDPLFARYPIRGFQADLAIVGDLAAALDGLRGAAAAPALLAQRAGRVADFQRRPAWKATAEDLKTPGIMTPKWVSTCIEQAKGADTVVINEYPLVLEQVSFSRPGTYFSHSPAGGLGWSMGAALGFRLAKPDSTVIVCVGDGTYMFGNPTPTHFVSRAMELPFLTVVFNNARWAAVHRATLSMYPHGHAARDNQPAFSCLEPSPDYEKLVEASGGYGERVDDPAELPAALKRALHAVEVEKRQAVLNVICEPVYVRTS
ncbi:MAG: thiamine pyrophosphate-requiring protein [Reyranellaceae bacterium]